MKEFKVGDRVRFIEHPGNDCWCATIGDIGTIKAIDSTGNNTWYAVELDIARRKYGSCDGICEKKRGLWSLAESLEHYVDEGAEEKKCEDEMVLNIKQLLDAGWKKEDIIKAVDEILKKQLYVGEYVKVINTACLLSYASEKIKGLTVNLDEMKNDIIMHYAFGWEPVNDGVEELKEKYTVLALDDKQALIMEVDQPSNLAKVLVIDKEGLEKWKD